MPRRRPWLRPFTPFARRRITSRCPTRDVTVGDDGGDSLAPAAGGKHRMLIADPAQKERIQQIYAEMASTKPVPRAQRFRPPQKKQ